MESVHSEEALIEDKSVRIKAQRQTSVIWIVIISLYFILLSLPFIASADNFDPSTKLYETVAAEKNLRDYTKFQWYIIPIFVGTYYVYLDTAGRYFYDKNCMSQIFAGLAFWLMDWINEI